MSIEVFNQLTTILNNAVSSKHGPYYAGLIAITGLSLGYILIESKYDISDGEQSIQPQEIATNQEI